jgi:hypothetical protein
MAQIAVIAVFSIMAAAAPALATNTQHDHSQGAPQASESARYCLRIEAVTGSRLEEVKCWTRQEWAEQDVDVDQEWAKEGVKVIG